MLTRICRLLPLCGLLLCGRLFAGEAPRERKEFDNPRAARERFLEVRLPRGRAELPMDLYLNRYLAAAAHKKGMPQRSALPPRAWTWLGPGNIGGRTRAIAVDPRPGPGGQNAIYAAGVSGGVWKSLDAGASWTALDDLLPSLVVSTLVLDPQNPDVIYAGTGEGLLADGQSDFQGAGIFKSLDAGATWSQLPGTQGLDFRFVNKLAISPSFPGHVYAATGTGVFGSFDGGQSWRSLYSASVRGGCLDLVLSRRVLFWDSLIASCGTFERASLVRNIHDGLGAWHTVLSEPGMGRTSLAAAPANRGVIYAAASSIAPRDEDVYGLHAVFRSTDGGATWSPRLRYAAASRLGRLLFSNVLVEFAEDCFGESFGPGYSQGWYDNVIAVDPLEPDIVWLGGIYLFRSEDGGSTWKLGVSAYGDEAAGHDVHPDIHALVFHPGFDGAANQQLLLGCDGGVYRTSNARAAATSDVCEYNAGQVLWTPLNHHYGVTQFYHGAATPDGRGFLGGTQDNGTLGGTEAGGTEGWSFLLGGDGGYVAVDPTDPRVMYAEVQGFDNLALFRSTDGGATFESAIEGITESHENFVYVAPFVLDPSHPRRLWMGGRSMWRSDDGARTWTQASAPLAQESSVTSIAVEPRSGNHVLAGLSDGSISWTEQGLRSGASTAWAASRPADGWVSSVAFDPVQPNVAYATYSTFGVPHVWKSLDNGASWTRIDGAGASGIPDIPAHSIVASPVAPYELFVGTDLGVFVSVDGGQSWAAENTGFANVITESLSVVSAQGRSFLFAFTHGRGAWRVPL